jgi:hypothetical protein
LFALNIRARISSLAVDSSRVFAVISNMSISPESSPRGPDVGRGEDAGLSKAAEVEAGEPKAPDQPKEIGGRKGPDPTRYGDWEKNGRCIDF